MRLVIRLLLPFMLAVGLVLGIALPAFAITAPDNLQINAVWVYRNCMEDNDQLYIVDLFVHYTGANPDENVTEAIILRLMDGTDELGSTAPYAYYDEGWDRQIATIYFSAADAPTWEGAYTMILAGNPTLDWGGDPPTTSVSTFDLWQDWPIATTQQVLSSRVLWLADQLELAWGVDMIETTASGSRLTDYGESYFVNAIPNLRIMAPYAFSGQTIQPEVEKREFTGDYATTLEGTVAGTPIDITPLATAFGFSRGALTAILYYAVVVVFIVIMVSKMQNYKGAILMTIPCVIGGAFIGVPLVITILAGFFSLVMIAYILFYQKSTA